MRALNARVQLWSDWFLRTAIFLLFVSLVFGGMAPMTVSAKNAESFLVGKDFTKPETLEGAVAGLEKDFNLPFGVPGGMATYR